MGRPRDYPSKSSKSDRERQIAYDTTVGHDWATDLIWYVALKNMIQMNLTRQKETPWLSEQTYGYWGGKREGMGEE